MRDEATPQKEKNDCIKEIEPKKSHGKSRTQIEVDFYLNRSERTRAPWFQLLMPSIEVQITSHI